MRVDRRPVIGVILVVALVASVIFWRGGRFAGALKPLTKFDGVIDDSHVTFDPVLSDLAVRASRALEDGDAKAAETIYREMVDRWPTDPETHSSLAACLYFQGDYEAAKTEYDQALQLDPKWGEALYGLGCLAFKQQQYDTARSYLEKALAVRETAVASHRLLGLVHQATGDRAAAIAHFERAIEAAASPAEIDDVRQWLEELKR